MRWEKGVCKGIVYFFFREKIAVPLTHSFWFNAVYIFFWWYIFFSHSLTPFGGLRYIFLPIGIFFYKLVYFFVDHIFLSKYFSLSREPPAMIQVVLYSFLDKRYIPFGEPLPVDNLNR